MQYNGSVIQEISLDVSRFNPIAPILVKQKDAYTRGFKVTITDNGTPLQIQNSAEVWFNCENLTPVIESGVETTKKASVEGTVNTDGTVTVFVPSVVMEIAGNIQCDISIITTTEVNNELTSQVLKTMTFMLDCQKAANPSGTSSAAEDDILVGLASGTIVPPSGEYVPRTRTIAGIPLSANISSSDLTSALSDDMYDDLQMEEVARLALDSTASINDLKPVVKGQYYYSSERGTIGVKTSEATPITQQSIPPQYIESYDTTTTDNKLADKANIETGSVDDCYNVNSSNLHLSGSYQLIGNMCFISAHAPLRQGQTKETYKLPVLADGYASVVAIGPFTNQQQEFGTIYHLKAQADVILIHKSDGTAFGSNDFVDFTISYKYGGS